MPVSRLDALFIAALQLIRKLFIVPPNTLQDIRSLFIEPNSRARLSKVLENQGNVAQHHTYPRLVEISAFCFSPKSEYHGDVVQGDGLTRSISHRTLNRTAPAGSNPAPSGSPLNPNTRCRCCSASYPTAARFSHRTFQRQRLPVEI